ncbi:MAG: alpha/beta fold hydrolase [Lachnospiraceae bacterium]|jgi:alpha-beta hydrolase superfamily lysophospholipase
MRSIPPFATVYLPPKFQPAIGTVQIVHGMAEHKGRYRDFAEFLRLNGYAVIIGDLRGHGTNVRREAELGYFGDNGAASFVSDVHEMTRYICETCPGVPYYLIGHGMGALICTAYIKKYDYFLDGLFLSGMPSEKNTEISRTICNIKIALYGEYHRSKSTYNSIYRCFKRGFSGDNSPTAWLSSDPDVCERYERDSACGYIYTLNGFRTYYDVMDNAYKIGSWIQKNPNLPIYIIAGSKDPCAGNRNHLFRIAGLFEAYNYENVNAYLLHGQRHDIYNDIGHERTYDFFINAFEKDDDTRVLSW